jgi:hypothetical protein
MSRCTWSLAHVVAFRAFLESLVWALRYKIVRRANLGNWSQRTCCVVFCTMIQFFLVFVLFDSAVCVVFSLRAERKACVHDCIASVQRGAVRTWLSVRTRA